ncbi:MAG: NAD-dependent succinate-semialdehyde dehydrogenase [Gammaproteobacteria bacterium]|nr:NAD-dependent succinate-semialdehyde dehydrogenase [Pseudomonadales bacterium]MCP5348494.1 NAD-dependent succinate-semialdehyde dehydrogenase [Pseudomonadales bacterium]
MTLLSINPANGHTIAEYKTHSQEKVDQLIADARTAFEDWRQVSLTDRSRVLSRAAEILKTNRESYALLMTREMGKPLSQSLGEIDKCADACRFYADKATEFLAPDMVMTEAPESFVCYEPLGVVLAVMPWNFPFWQVFRFAAPGLMAGNAGLLKHASNVSGCALAIENIFREAGLPDGLFSTLLIKSQDVERVIEHKSVSAVTLTGSGAAGASVASTAGKALKKSVLELGGSDAYVVLADADLDLAARICAKSRMNNNGQTCIAAKRLIVESGVKEEFEQKLLRQLENYQPGDPEQEQTNQGPMARTDLRDELHSQVEKSIAAGARCLLGGKVPDGPGSYYPATLLTDVDESMPAFHEELFGPVASVIAASDEEDAISKANNSEFGLGAAVFTSDIDRGRHIAAHRLEAGTCVVNDFVRSDPRLPFGGIKQSGYGRELSHFGIREFVNIKTVYSG